MRKFFRLSADSSLPDSEFAVTHAPNSVNRELRRRFETRSSLAGEQLDVARYGGPWRHLLGDDRPLALCSPEFRAVLDAHARAAHVEWLPAPVQGRDGTRQYFAPHFLVDPPALDLTKSHVTAVAVNVPVLDRDVVDNAPAVFADVSGMTYLVCVDAAALQALEARGLLEAVYVERILVDEVPTEFPWRLS